MTYEPMTLQERLLVKNLLRARVKEVQSDPRLSEEAYRLAVSALEKLSEAVDVLVVRQ